MKPREDRRVVAIPARVERQGGHFVDVEVVNISNGGCRVRYKKTLWVGEAVELQMPDLPPIPAQVRWSLLGNAGLKFIQANRHKPPRLPVR